MKAGTASGTFKLENGQTIAPRYATAFIVREGVNARQKLVEILLTEKPVTAAPLQQALDPHVAAVWIGSADDTNYILLRVMPDGTVHMNTTYSDMRQYNNDSTTGLTATLTTNTPTRIEGRITTPTPQTGMRGTTYTVDLRFAVDVPPMIMGDALPAGGGEPGKAFLAFLDVVQKKDWAAITAASAPTLLEAFSGPPGSPALDADQVLERVTLLVPPMNATVPAGDLRGDTAILDIEGEASTGGGSLTLVRMVKIGTAWKVAEIRRAGFLP
jgi:hypothetical protein